MNRERMSYILAGFVTLIVVSLIPAMIQDFLNKNRPLWQRLTIIGMPALLYLLWYGVRKDIQRINRQGSSDSVKNKSGT